MKTNDRPDWAKYVAFGYWDNGFYVTTCNGATAEEAESKMREILKGRNINRISIRLTEEVEADERARQQVAKKGVIVGRFGKPQGYVEHMLDALH